MGLIKDVRVRMSLMGKDDVSRGMEDVSRKGDEFSKKTYTATLGLDDKKADATMDDFRAKLDEVGKRVETARLATDDKNARAELLKFQFELHKIGQSTTDAKVGIEGIDKASERLAKLGIDLSKFGERHDTATADVNVNDGKLKELDLLLDKVGKKRATAEANVKDSEGRAKLIDFKLKLDKIGEMRKNAKIGVEGTDAALRDIYRVDAALDRLGRKNERARIGTAVPKGSKSKGLLGKFGGLFGGGGDGAVGEAEQAGEAGAEGAGSAGSGLTGIAGTGGVGVVGSLGPVGITIGATLIGAIVATIVAMTPAIIATGVGAVTVAGGFMAAAFAGGAVKKKMMTGLHDLMDTAKKTIGEAVGPFINAFSKMIPGIDKFIKGEAGPLKNLFSGAIPFLREFVKMFEQSAKIVIPAFTESMHQLQPYLPMIVKGLVRIVQGVAQMLRAFGPGMKSSAQVFVGVCKFIGTSLDVLGKVFSWVANVFMSNVHGMEQTIRYLGDAWNWLYKEGSKVWNGLWATIKSAIGNITHGWGQFTSWIENTWKATTKGLTNAAKNMWQSLVGLFEDIKNGVSHAWDWLTAHITSGFMTAWHAIRGFATGLWHDLTNTFDSIKSDISHAWDTAWNWITSRLKSAVNAIVNVATNWWHGVTHIFDQLSNDITSVWHTAWDWITSRIRSGVNAVENFASSLWHDVTHIFQQLGSDITNAWHTAWDWIENRIKEGVRFVENIANGWWNDLKQGFTDIKNWITSTWDSIWSWVEQKTSSAISFVGRILNNLKNAFLVPVRFVVDDVIDPLGHLWNDVVKGLHLPLPQFPELHMAQGGEVRGPKSVGDNIPILATAGERVLSIPQVNMLGGHQAIDQMVGTGSGGPLHFAGGGQVPPVAGMPTRFSGKETGRPSPKPGGSNIIGWIGSLLGKTGDEIGSLFSGASSIIDAIGKDAASAAVKIAFEAFGIKPNHPGPLGLAEDAAIKMLTAAITSLTSSAQSANTSTGSGSGSEVAKYAASYATGKKHPYVMGGAVPTGWDCSGFSAWVYHKFGFFPGKQGQRYGTSESQFASPKLQKSDEQPGALVFFNTHDGQPAPSHVGVVVRKGFYAGADDPAVGTIISSDKGNMGFRIPKGGFPASGGFTGTGAQAVYTYLLGNMFSGNKIAAAGATASIGGESNWNPESQGTGGRGLIGWTPPGTLPNSAFTGNAKRDMGAQLAQIGVFVRKNGDEGVISSMKKAKTVEEAAQEWCHGVERAGIDDVHPQNIAVAKRLAGLRLGGVINEPSLAFGLRSGTPFMLAEDGPERVYPTGETVAAMAKGNSNGGVSIYVDCRGNISSDPKAIGAAVDQSLTKYIRTGLGGQRPSFIKEIKSLKS